MLPRFFVSYRSHGWFLLSFVLLSSCLNVVHSQAVPAWQAALHGGLSSISGDVAARTGIGGGLSLQRNLGQTFALRVDYTGSINKGLDVALRNGANINDNNYNDPWLFFYEKNNRPFVANYKNNLHQFSLSALVRIANWNYASSGRFSLYAPVGYSFIASDVDVDALDPSGQLYNFSSINFNAGKGEVRKQLNGLMDGKFDNNAYYKGRTQEAGKNFQFDHAVHAGLGVDVSLTSKIGVALEYRLTNAFTDLLDGIKEKGKSDMVHYTSLRLTYSLGSLVKRAARKINPDGTQVLTTSPEQLAGVSGFIKADVTGEARFASSDTSYYMDITFVPSVPTSVTTLQAVYVKLSNTQVLSFQYAGMPGPIKANVPFTYRIQLNRKDLQALAASKTTDIKIETTAFSLEDKIVPARQGALADVAKQLLRRR